MQPKKPWVTAKSYALMDKRKSLKAKKSTNEAHSAQYREELQIYRTKRDLTKEVGVMKDAM